MNKGDNGVHTNEQSERKMSDMSASAFGIRPNKRATLNVLKETTDLVLADLGKDSKFFNENLPMPLPVFDKTGKWRYQLHCCFIDQEQAYFRNKIKSLISIVFFFFVHRSRVGNNAWRRRVRRRP
jgi:hypothetical protein